MAWKILNTWTDSGMTGNAAELTAEKDGQTVYVSVGTTEFGHHYVVSSRDLFVGDASDSIIAEYSTQREALASPYGPVFRKAIEAFRKIGA